MVMSIEFIGVKTRILLPPKDDFFSVLGESLPPLLDGDILLIATKVLAIHQGRCVGKSEVDKLQLIGEEAEYIFGEISDPCVTIKGGAMVPNGGVDESNGSGYYILWPQNITALLGEIHTFLREKFTLTNLGIIAADSRVLPMRTGTVGISQGSFGFVPIFNLIGRMDLFGRALERSNVNIADALAGMAPLILGEANEACPLAIIRGVGGISFSQHPQPSSNLIGGNTDLFGELLKLFRKK
jgi:F420-0:gamma-glutamyl ligase